MSNQKKGALLDPKKQAFLRDRERLALYQNGEDFKFLMSHPQGRRFMYRLAYGICGVENGIWSASAEIHYMEGRRSVGIEVKNEAQRLAPREYVQMIQEQINDAAQLQETRQVVIDDAKDEE
jgi:hypothetical protein